MNFEQILESSLQRRRVFENMNQSERKEYFKNTMYEVQNIEPFGRMYFNINMINDWYVRTNLYIQFATSIAMYYNSIIRQRDNTEDMTRFMFTAVEKLTKKRLDQQEMYEEDGIDR